MSNRPKCYGLHIPGQWCMVGCDKQKKCRTKYVENVTLGRISPTQLADNARLMLEELSRMENKDE